MARHLTPTPHALEGRAFSAGEGLAAGLSPKVLRHSRFHSVHWGARTTASLPSDTAFLRQRSHAAALEYLPLIRRAQGEAFSHTTALLMYGAPIRCASNLHVAIPKPSRVAQRRNVQGHTAMAEFTPWVFDAEAGTLPVVPPDLALFQAASLLSFRELVVAADHLIVNRRNVMLAEHEQLIEQAAFASVRSIRRLRAALEVARVGAESRMETILHFELARMGLDTLELQADVYDQHGNWIGRFDGVDRRGRRIMEYDGEQHRIDRGQYLKDLERLDRAREAGYRILRLHKEDFSQEQLARTRRRMCEFLGKQPRPIAPRLASFFVDPS